MGKQEEEGRKKTGKKQREEKEQEKEGDREAEKEREKASSRSSFQLMHVNGAINWDHVKSRFVAA